VKLVASSLHVFYYLQQSLVLCSTMFGISRFVSAAVRWDVSSDPAPGVAATDSSKATQSSPSVSLISQMQHMQPFLVSQAFTIAPQEVVKVRMQSLEHGHNYNNGALSAFRQMLRNEGVSVFAKGLEPAMLRHGAWSGAYFGIIHWLKMSVLWTPAPDSTASTLGRNFTAGLIAGTVATTLNTPFDVITSRMRNVLPGEPTPYRWAWPSLVTIAREEGPRALWKGFTAKVARLGPGGGIVLVVFELASS